ncbi:heme oxygenase (chloroplast) [Guillardia theta]|uniref:Heme oxygenase n=2 Tax=Guillardia theta TaxID=55529 RepID=HO_GUITH
MSNNLAIQLREGTSKSHSMAENVSFVKSFLSGVIDTNSYKKMMSNLYFVYKAMEEEMEYHKENDLIKPIYFVELNRSESLALDLNFYYGDTWKDIIEPSEATRVYINRIKKISKEKPLLLIAHAYTRYLGDLSGGQILKKIAQRALNVPNSQGLAFYEFDKIDDEQAFKQKYKKALDTLPVTDKMISQIVAEANIAFNLNMRMFQELEMSYIRIFTKILMQFLINSKDKLRVMLNFS